LEQAIFHLINQQWTNPALDLFMAALSDGAIWMPLLIVIGLIALVFGGFKMRVCICCILLTLLITEQVTGALKSAIDRRRPKQTQRVRMVELEKGHRPFPTRLAKAQKTHRTLQMRMVKLLKKVRWNSLALFKKPASRYSESFDRDRLGPSFPSGHVANNTVIAVCCTVFYRRRGWLFWILPLAVGYSRIYVGAHWPSDVIATLFLAAGEAFIIIGILELIWRTAARKWAPDIFARHPSLLVGQVRNLPSEASQVGNSRHAK
jgi:membrane-associated phospholipid phosphatase